MEVPLFIIHFIRLVVSTPLKIIVSWDDYSQYSRMFHEINHPVSLGIDHFSESEKNGSCHSPKEALDVTPFMETSIYNHIYIYHHIPYRMAPPSYRLVYKQF